MSINYYQEWRDAGHDYHSDPVTEADVCGPEDDPNYVTEPELPLYFDSTDPWCHWMIAELIIACNDDTQSAVAPW